MTLQTSPVSVTVHANSAPTESQPDQPSNRPGSMLLLSGRTTTTVPDANAWAHIGPVEPRQSISAFVEAPASALVRHDVLAGSGSFY